jgi:hypothetical protein
MALSKTRVIHSQGREIAHNARKHMSEAELNGITNPLKHVCAMVLAVTGIPKRGLARTNKGLK